MKVKMKIGKSSESIKNKILNTALLIVASSLVALGIISSLLSYSSANSLLNQTMIETASIAADAVSSQLEEYKFIAQEVGSIARIANFESDIEEKRQLIQQKVDTYGFVEGNIIGIDGINIFNGIDSSEREYFKQSMQGNAWITEPTISKATGKLSIIVSAPIWKDGIVGTEIVGVVMFIPQENFLNDIISSIRIGKNGSAYMLDKDGYNIADIDIELVENRANDILASQTDPSLKSIAAIENEMIAGNSGIGKFNWENQKHLVAYSPVENTNGWSLGIIAPTSDFMTTTIIGIITTILIVIATIIISVIFISRLAKDISDPIKSFSSRLNLLVDGDLNSPVPEIQTEDELSILAAATTKIVSTMNFIIGDIDYLLKEMASGNYNVTSKSAESYVGDYNSILESLRSMKRSLNSTVIQIKSSTDQVALGAEQMATSAQELAEGATDQAGTVEELLATVQDVSEQVERNAREAISTSEKAASIGEEANSSKTQMTEMTSAMARISEASEKIANITKSIEDIASQTNLLSLNASIEAARAGEAGKGFAVVAQEIRKLADESGKAAEETRRLIQAALEEVNKGTEISNGTSLVLEHVVNEINSIVTEVQNVANMSEQQSESISQINQAIEQITNVVQSNSATAEETSATSQELASQASTLDGLLEHFVLAEDLN